LRRRIIIFVSIIQSILFLGHWFLYETWISFFGPPESPLKLKLLLGLLSVSFVSTTWLAFRYSNLVVRLLYTFPQLRENHHSLSTTG